MTEDRERSVNHRLLLRQLNRLGIDPDTLPEDVLELLHIVEHSYRQYEDDHQLLEHSLELTSLELVERNQKLHDELGDKERDRKALQQHREELESRYARQTLEIQESNKRLRAEISERERAEASLRESETWLRGLFHALEEAVVVIDGDANVITLNPAASRLFHVSLNELRGGAFTQLYDDPESSPLLTRRVLDQLEGGQAVRETQPFRRGDGSTFPGDVTLTQLRKPDGDVLGTVCVVRDLTEHERNERIRAAVTAISEAALSVDHLEDLLRIIHEQIGTLIDARNFFVSLYDREREVYTIPYIVDLHDDYPSNLEIKGKRSVTDYVRRTGRPLLADSDQLNVLEDLGEIEMVGTPSHHWMGVPMRTREGVIGVVVVQTYDEDQRYTENQFDLMIRVGEQIGYAVERKRSEETLRASEQRNRAILDALPDLVFVINRRGAVLDYHAPFTEILFVEPERFLGRPVEEYMPASFIHELHKSLDAVLETRAVQVFEYQLSMNDRIRWFEGRMVPIDEEQVLCVVRDRTDQIDAERERLELETQMQHTQKLESLGVLAGGIAHDFNNLLVGMLGNANLALSRLEEDIPVQDLIERIQAAAMRAADLTRQMLAYSGKGSFVIEPIDLASVIEEMNHLLGVSISKHVEVVQEFSTEPVIIEADSVQIGQVVMNLITNASEAIGEQPGTILVRTGHVELSDEDIRHHVLDHEIEPGRYALVEIQDNGSGMDKETMDRMFDPFFTTKFTGRGLGLAAVLGIVRSHKGALAVESELGAGTTIRLYFPPAGGGEVSAASEDQDKDVDISGGTVLIVDDDETVREVASMMLSQAGLEVLEAEDGVEGVEQYEKHADQIGLVLLDMTMPRMDGAETFRRLRGMDPDVRVLLTSGYNEKDATSRLDPGLAGFIQKPYQLNELLAAVRKAMSGNSAS